MVLFYTTWYIINPCTYPWSHRVKGGLLACDQHRSQKRITSNNQDVSSIQDCIMAVACSSHCRSKIVLFLCLQPDFLWHMDIEPVFMSPITLLQCLHNNLLEIPCNLSLLWGPGLWSSLLPDTVGWGR